MTTPLQPGDIVERYRVESTLGEGGTARVYRVRHTTLETVHALKVLTIDHPQIRDRLISEGKAQATLNHANIVAVRDVLDINGSPALLMDFVPGPNLATHLNNALPHPDETMRLFKAIATGVAYAHDRGLIHRDLKPGNVLIDLSSEPAIPRVTDFGLVRFLHPPQGQERRTAVGVMMGTLGYMAPEQLRDSHTADERTDVFSLGALLYAMIAGRPPFGGKDQLQVMNDTAECRYVPLSDHQGDQFDPRFDAIVKRCLNVDPNDRYQSTHELLGDIQSPPPPSDPHQTLHWALEQETRHTPDPLPPLGSLEKTTLPQTQWTAQQAALIVDAGGKGHQVELGVHLDPEGNGILHPPNVGRDTTVAAQLSAAVALKGRAEAMGIRWGIRGFTADLHGTSLGLPLAVALWCAANDKVMPAGVALTGGLDLDGRVAPVSGIPAKIRAAAQAGSHTVFVPADGLGKLEIPAGITVLPARTFDGVIGRLFEPQPTSPKRVVRWGFAWMIVPLLMALTGLTTRIEPLIHDPLLRAIHGALPADNTAIVAFPPQRDARALRTQHPGTIDALVDAGAKSIFFDVILLAETEHDEAIAQAITRATEAGVPVILPLMTENDEVLFPESEALRDAAWFGAVIAQTDTTFWQVRRAPMRIHSLDGGEHWHAAAQTVRAHLGAELPPTIDGSDLIIGPNRNPVWADLAYLHPAEPSPTVSYNERDSFSIVRGRSVLVGEMGGADDVHRIDSGAVYGVEIEAALIETLLQQRAPRILSPEVSALWAVLVGLGTAMMGLLMPRNRRWLSWFVPIGGIAISVTLVVAGLLIAFFPMLIAAGMGLWLSQRSVSETNQQAHP